MLSRYPRHPIRSHMHCTYSFSHGQQSDRTRCDIVHRLLDFTADDIRGVALYAARCLVCFVTFSVIWDSLLCDWWRFSLKRITR